MANGAILLKWRDRNWAEEGHYIYRSDSPMDVNALPNPIATVGGNSTQYTDYDVIQDQTYYYRIASYRNNEISISDEIQIKASPSTLGMADVFGDGSILGYYRLDGNALDETNQNHGIETNATYAPAVYDLGLQGGYIMSDLVVPDVFTISLYMKKTSQGGSLRSVLEFHTESNTKHIIGHTQSGIIGPVYGADTAETNSGSIDYMYTVNRDQWYHVVYDSDQNFYVDGVAQTSSGSEAYYGGSMDHPFAIKFRSRGNNEFPGEVDQVRVFNRVLTTNEIDILGNET